MMLGTLITKALAAREIGMQFITQNLTNITKGKRGQCRVTFVTTDITPSQVLHGTGPVGIVLWIPRDIYEELADQPDEEAVQS